VLLRSRAASLGGSPTASWKIYFLSDNGSIMTIEAIILNPSYLIGYLGGSLV
jgi:hypothetical protein